MAYRPTTYFPMLTTVEGLTIRPVAPEGDDYFGLATGSNGTAAELRRRIAELQTPSPAGNSYGLTWVRASGAPAHGIQYVPGDSDRPASDPWSGEP